MSTCTRLILIVPIFLQTVSGEICYDDDGQQGECKKVRNCSSAMESIINNVWPKKHCGFDKLEPMVCCVETAFPPGCKAVVRQARQTVEQTSSPEGWPSNLSPPGGIGGINSLSKEFPHMAALGYENEDGIIWLCGGTLITRNYILTAAHCLVNINYGRVKYVRLGDLNLKDETDDAEPQNFEVTEWIKHPQYKRPYNDIGILKLDKPCRLTAYVRPACLHTKKELPDGDFSATGWGTLGFGEDQSDHLQNMIIKVFNHTKCAEAYSNIKRLSKGIDEETQLCAGAPNVDTCPGDSGGPLQMYGADNTVYGVTSFGVRCGISRIPGVYTRVSAYIPWIKSVIS